MDGIRSRRRNQILNIDHQISILRRELELTGEEIQVLRRNMLAEEKTAHSSRVNMPPSRREAEPEEEEEEEEGDLQEGDLKSSVPQRQLTQPPSKQPAPLKQEDKATEARSGSRTMRRASTEGQAQKSSSAKTSKKRSLNYHQLQLESEIDEVEEEEEESTVYRVQRRRKVDDLKLSPDRFTKQETSESEKRKSEIFKSGRMQEIVSKNRQSLSKKQEEVTCTICLDEVEKAKQAKVSGCSHVFCYECIYNWAKKEENTCPNCKARFNKITIKNVCGEEMEIEVERKERSMTAAEEACSFCGHQIGVSAHLVCGVCMDRYAHSRCIPTANYEYDHYHCSACIEQGLHENCDLCYPDYGEESELSEPPESFVRAYMMAEHLAAMQNVFRSQQSRPSRLGQPSQPEQPPVRRSLTFSLPARDVSSRDEVKETFNELTNQLDLPAGSTATISATVRFVIEPPRRAPQPDISRAQSLLTSFLHPRRSDSNRSPFAQAYSSLPSSVGQQMDRASRQQPSQQAQPEPNPRSQQQQPSQRSQAVQRSRTVDRDRSRQQNSRTNAQSNSRSNQRNTSRNMTRANHSRRRVHSSNPQSN